MPGTWYTLVILRSHGQKIPVVVWPASLAYTARPRSQREILVFCFSLLFKLAPEEYYVAHAGLEFPCLCLLSAGLRPRTTTLGSYYWILNTLYLIWFLWGFDEMCTLWMEQCSFRIPWCHQLLTCPELAACSNCTRPKAHKAPAPSGLNLRAGTVVGIFSFCWKLKCGGKAGFKSGICGRVFFF